MSIDIRAALYAAEQHATFNIWAGHPLAIILEGLVKKIRAALNAEAPPTMELGALFDRHCFEDDYGNKYLNAEAFESAALELAARAALAAEPVAVAERPWERDGWCNAEGQCWALSPDHNSWQLAKPRFLSFWVLLLPAHAIPLPQAGEGES